MSECDVREAVSTLIHTLRRTRGDHGLSWIIRQVSNGFVAEANNYSDAELYSVLIDYPDASQVLEQLLDAIRLVLVESALMEDHIRRFFCEKLSISHVLFDLFEADSADVFIFDLSGPPSDERQTTSRALSARIDQIKRLLHDDACDETVDVASYTLSDDLLAAWSASKLSLNDLLNLYALYVFTLVVDTAAMEGAEVTYWDRSGQLEAVPRFLTGPHPMHADDYMFAQLYFSARRYLEVHIGTRFTGKSSVEHEYDIAVLRRKSANKARSKKRTPSYRNLLFALECKFYAGTIQLDMARACLGLIDDLTTSPRGRNLYVASSPIVDAGTQLLTKHHVAYHPRIVPSAAPHDGLVADIREIFRQYQRGEA